MADRELLDRIDDHMSRGNELMSRGNEIMIENRQAFQDLRVELRQMSLRGERVARECIAELRAQRGELGGELVAQRGELGKPVDEVRDLRLELREETRAQHQALFAMIDRLQGGGPSTAGA